MSLTEGLLDKYTNTVFVETGTFHGDGVCDAIDAGFKTIHSIDIDGAWIEKARKKATKHNRRSAAVNFHTGLSTEVLPELCRQYQNEVTFWLDAHPPGALSIAENTIRKYSPVMEELAVIKRGIGRPKYAAILVDDLRLFSKEDRAIILNFMSSFAGAEEPVLENGHIHRDIAAIRIRNP